MGERADVVVIGAGLGGLLTAAILGRRGARVILLEKEQRLGGRLRTYRTPDGFSIDCGAFLWLNRHLDGAMDAAGATGFSAFTIPDDEVIRLFVEGRDGRPFMLPRPGLPESPALLESAAAVYGSVSRFREVAKLWQTLARMPEAERATLAHLSLDAWLARHAPNADAAEGMRRAVMLFGAVVPGTASIGEFSRLIGGWGNGEPARPQICGANRIGGMMALVESLTAACRRAGIDVRLGSPVAQLVIEAGRASGVRYYREPQSLETVAADSVVCNVPAWDLFRIVPERHFPESFVQHVRHHGRAGESVNLALAFRGLPTLRASGQEDRFRGWSRLLFGPEGDSGGGMMWTTHAASQNAPAGCHLLHVTRHVRWGTIRDAESVDTVVQGMMTILGEVYVDLETRLLWRRYWGTPDGTEHVISMVPRPPLRAPGVHGLYLVGETVAAGTVQMDNAARAAVEVAGMIRPSRDGYCSRS